MYRDLQRPFLKNLSAPAFKSARDYPVNAPEVVGAVFVSDDDGSNLGVGLDGIDAVCRVGEVLLNVSAEALERRFSYRLMSMTLS